jgi:hypothetical protein
MSSNFRERAVVTLLVIAGVLSTWSFDAPGAQTVPRSERQAAPNVSRPAFEPAAPVVTFVTGGIGKEEADAMRADAPNYALELVFVRKVDNREEFVSDVRLRIADQNDRVVVERAAGPIVLAQVPNGTYTIVAEFGGQTRTQRVALSPGRHEKITMVWS